MEKILIVKTSSLGDIIHTYPALHYLRKKFPSAQIDWVVEAPYAELVNSHPYVNRTLLISTKKWRKSPFSSQTWKEINKFRKELRECAYDQVFDFQGNLKSGLVTSQAISAKKIGFGSRSIPEWPNLLFTNHRINPLIGGNIREDYLALVSDFFNETSVDESSNIELTISPENKTFLHNLLIVSCKKEGPKVVVCSGSAWPNKRLKEETLVAFLVLVQSYLQCEFLFIWGSSQEFATAKYLQSRFEGQSTCIEKMGLSMLQNFMSLCDLVIAMDSLPLHLAGTTSTPSFSFFGASSAAKYKPLGSLHGSFQGKCPYGKTFPKRCPILRTCSTGACIQDLEANALFESFTQWWLAMNPKISC